MTRPATSKPPGIPAGGRVAKPRPAIPMAATAHDPGCRCRRYSPRGPRPPEMAPPLEMVSPLMAVLRAQSSTGGTCSPSPSPAPAGQAGEVNTRQAFQQHAAVLHPRPTWLQLSASGRGRRLPPAAANTSPGCRRRIARRSARPSDAPSVCAASTWRVGCARRTRCASAHRPSRWWSDRAAAPWRRRRHLGCAAGRRGVGEKFRQGRLRGGPLGRQRGPRRPDSNRRRHPTVRMPARCRRSQRRLSAPGLTRFGDGRHCTMPQPIDRRGSLACGAGRFGKSRTKASTGSGGQSRLSSGRSHRTTGPVPTRPGGGQRHRRHPAGHRDRRVGAIVDAKQCQQPTQIGH